jgi:hypothetical protein
MHVLAFFAASDGIVLENLAVRFMAGAPPGRRPAFFVAAPMSLGLCPVAWPLSCCRTGAAWPPAFLLPRPRCCASDLLPRTRRWASVLLPHLRWWSSSAAERVHRRRPDVFAGAGGQR